MRSIREILRLKAEGLPDREIAASVGCARSTLCECLKRARAAGITWPLPEELDEAALVARLYPGAALKRHVESFPEPDFAEVARELTRKHVTRRQLWREYRARYPRGLGYTAFCVHYRRWRATSGVEVTRALEHEPGDRLYVDYSGDPAAIGGCGTPGGPARKPDALARSLYFFAACRASSSAITSTSGISRLFSSTRR